MIYSSTALNAEVHRQQTLSRQIAQLQTDVSTGVKVHVASDDPAAAAQIATLGRIQASQASYTTNLAVATAVSADADSNLDSVTSALTRVTELMTQASNGTMSDSDRATAASTLAGLRSTIQSYAAAKDSYGNALYPSGQAVQIPIADGLSIAATSSYDETFGSVTAADGSTKSIDSILGDAIAALQTTDSTARQTAVATSLTNLSAAADHINTVHSDIGLREQRITAASDALETAKTNTKVERTGWEDTDQTEAISSLTAKMTVLSAAQSILAQLSKISLFDKLG